ncbi:hypothetical protein JCM10212_004591 [Sporobolomyces blumeae]
MSPTPPPPRLPNPAQDDAKDDLAELVTEGAVGRLDRGYYRKLMPGWRCAVREYLVSSLEREIDDLVDVQATWRTRFRDQYFVKTSLLGTHTFFMVFIPIWAWFGFPEVARGLLYLRDLLGTTGGYVTSVLKDAFCVPRPFSPPVHRLSVGSHALEYGFPSTHSSNALSMSLFFGELVVRRNPAHWAWSAGGVAALFVFAWSITFGRLYTGMHSRMDVRVGATLGVVVWLVTWFGEGPLERLVVGTKLVGTTVIVPVLLLLVTFHPQPAENCPCFEDAIAFLSVFAGILVGLAWCPYRYADHTIGHAWEDWQDVGMWTVAGLTKLVIGISSILVWRIVAKFLCHQALPPVFRFFAPIISLPRRYYLAATEYGSYPEQKSLNPVPSILDLPSLAEDAELSIPPASGSSSSSSRSGTSLSSARFLRSRSSRTVENGSSDGSNGPALLASSTTSSKPVKNDGSAALPHARPSVPVVPSLSKPEKGDFPSVEEGEERRVGRDGTKSHARKGRNQDEERGGGGGEGREGGGDEVPIHLDADVLTKVVVYAGIGIIATVTLPWLFGGIGLNVWRADEVDVRQAVNRGGFRLGMWSGRAIEIA